MTKLLLLLGVSPNICCDLHKGTPLHHAVSTHLHNVASGMTTMMALHPFKCRPKIEDIDCTALMCNPRQFEYYPPLSLNTSERNCSTEVTKLLLQHNSDTEARDRDFQTSIQNAVSCNKTEVVKLLLDHNANIETKDRENRTPLHHAVLYCNHNRNMVELLLEHQADIDAKDKYSRTPLHHAVLQENRDLLELLIEHKADIEARDKDWRTPLHLAASQNSKSMVELLLKHNANTEARDKDNETPLSHAKKNIFNVTTQLLKYKAEIESRDKKKSDTSSPCWITAKNINSVPATEV